MTTSPGRTVSKSSVAPFCMALKYCVTGSTWPRDRVCCLANSMAPTKSGNHGIATSSLAEVHDASGQRPPRRPQYDARGDVVSGFTMDPTPAAH